MLNNADVPVADDTIEHRLSYFFGEAPKILEALIEAGINTELGIATLALDEDEGEDKMSVIDFITQLIALYMANYEKDGRFAGPEFQEVFFGYIEKLYKNKDLMDSIPDEYKYVFMFLVRKLLWYHTTINPNRDSLYLNGTVDDLLNFVLMYLLQVYPILLLKLCIFLMQRLALSLGFRLVIHFLVLRLCLLSLRKQVFLTHHKVGIISKSLKR